MNAKKFFLGLICLLLVFYVSQDVDAQDTLARQAYAIFEQNCLNCHGTHGAYTEELIIEHTALIHNGSVLPGSPDASEIYRRLIDRRVERRMPLGQPPLSPAAIDTVRRWILAGAPKWENTFESDGPFITPTEMLETMENHVTSLSPFDRGFARYFTMTHLYNAGETTEALLAYRRALSKLVNSLSWGREIIKPQPIDPQGTIFYIDLRDYEWEIGTNRWTLIEAEYPYNVDFDAPTQTALREKLTNLRAELNCDVPFVHVDWFLANASLPPLYHEILDLPLTDRELETRLEVNVVENIRNAPGRRVWRAGFNDSGVSNHNRVVERHLSRYGAYWKSYDFAGSVGRQNIFTHPLSFTHDGGEIIFNLPNGLQAYYLADAGGNRLDAAPINIVRNPAASDPTVRNGLSCIGCHTEGMKVFEDKVRGVVEQNTTPPFDKDRALRLYVEKVEMDSLVAEDTDRFRVALEKTGDVFGGIEPVQRFHEAFQRPLGASHAAAAVGLETETFLEKIRESTSLQSFGLLVLENGTVKRDTWTSNFTDVIAALATPESVLPPVVQRPERIPGAGVYIPDPNLRAAIAEALGKAPGDPITAEEMAPLNYLNVEGREIRDLTGLEFATNLHNLVIDNNLISDLSPLAELHNLVNLGFAANRASDLSPLVGLKNLSGIHATGNNISDLSPLSGVPNLKRFGSWDNPLSDLSPLIELESIDICGGTPDISTLTGAKNLRELYFRSCNISDISPLAEFTGLERLSLEDNEVSDISPLTELTKLKWLNLEKNSISDVSALGGLTNLKWLNLEGNAISDFSPLDGLQQRTTIRLLHNPGSPKHGPKIEGPWLWVIAPIGDRTGKEAAASGVDFLAEISGGDVTELEVATKGAVEGNRVGDSVWVSHKISASGIDNINDMVNAAGLGTGDINRHVAYGVVHLFSEREQNINMFVGSNDAVKVWLNGKLVHNNPVHRFSEDYQDVFPVTLEIGKNVLLVAVYEDYWEWSGFFGFEGGTEYDLLQLVDIPELVDILDLNLRDAIAEALGKAPGDTITAAEMATLREIDAWGRDISDLTGLEFAKNLTELYIYHNPLSDLSPLASLTKLREVYFGDTEVADLSPLSGLHELEEINASATRIRSLVPLAGLKNLKRLDTVQSDITDISPLAGLTNLTRLRLYDSIVTDLSPLKGLTKLKWLGLTSTENITDFSPLSGLTELKHLGLHNTGISDFSALSGLVNLETLILSRNQIVDVSLLASLRNLETLELSENNIVDVSPLASLHNLKRLELHINNISDFSPLDDIRETIELFTWYSNPGFPQGGQKITGPWLWLTLSSEEDEDVLLRDYLATASNNKVTEQQIATLGASEGTAIRESVWSVGTLESYKADGKWSNIRNLTRLLDAQGTFEFRDGENFVVYSSITLYSPRTQHTKIFIGASEPRKVYLNGKLVYEDYVDHSGRTGAYDYQTFFPITLQPGRNVLLIKLGDEWDNDVLSLFFGFEPNTEYSVVNPRVGYTFSDSKIHVGDTFTLDLSAENVIDFAGWQFDMAFDPAVLEAVEVNEGDFLKTGGGTTFFQEGSIDNTTGKITKLSSARLNDTGVSDTGTLLSVIFTAKAGGDTEITLENFQLGSITGETIPAGPHVFAFTIAGELTIGDVNRDGQVNVLDMILVGRHFGEDASANPQADVNSDGVINIQDLLLVAQHLGESTAAAAPCVIASINSGELTPAMIQAWIEEAEAVDDGSLAFQEGIATLERLLAEFIPEETALLANYPNPFNPETWIPYQLTEGTAVTLTIYAVDGRFIRQLDLGHQPAGVYHSKVRAAYWDGRNEVGEPVASGLYFYTLTAGEFTATRKMLIRK